MASGSGLCDQSLLNELSEERAFFNKHTLRELFAQDPQRFQHFTVSCADLMIDFSKNKLRKETLQYLTTLATSADLQKKQNSLFKGELFNQTEQRAALHSALRAPLSQRPAELASQIEEAQQRLFAFAAKINDGAWRGHTAKPIQSIVNIGIGGSDLGPAMTVAALGAYHKNPDLSFHFVSNIDPTDIQTTLAQCNPETTLFIIASKTFTTLETLSNANAARQWFLNSGAEESHIKQHFVAISTSEDRVVEFGIARENMFPMWDWVGGRYSIWSAIGLPLCIAIGEQQFKAFLDGAYQVDCHFLKAPPAANAPVIMALLSIWYSEFFNVQSHGILCYEHYLDKFPDYLQQLDMESNGKQVTFAGKNTDYNTGIPVWGNVGSNSQHSFHQLLHQGTITVPVDFIVGVNACHPCNDLHEQLYANCLAQSQALMKGRNAEEVAQEMRATGCNEEEIKRLTPHKLIPGNKPSTTIVYPKLSPSVLGQLIALYEHKVFTQSVIWDTNPFDQWGVELGKQLSKGVFGALNTNSGRDQLDSSTVGLIEIFNRNREQ